MEGLEIVNLVGSLGFPVAMALLLFSYIKNESKQQIAALEALKVVVENTNKLIERLHNEKGV